MGPVVPSKKQPQRAVMKQGNAKAFVKSLAHQPPGFSLPPSVAESLPLLITADLLALDYKHNQWSVLLVRRSAKETHGANQWSIPGGKVEHHETLEQALIREIGEELGCKVVWYSYFRSYVEHSSSLQQLPNATYQSSSAFSSSPSSHAASAKAARIVRAIYFYGQLKGKIVLDYENSAYQWVALEKKTITAMDIAFNQKQVLLDFLSYFQSLNHSSSTKNQSSHLFSLPFPLPLLNQLRKGLKNPTHKPRKKNQWQKAKK